MSPVYWADVVAERLLKRGASHRVASGTSVSGVIHIGNAGDVIYADGIARALESRGARADVVWIADDVDPLRAVPEQLPASFAEHLGKPVSALPDPHGCHERLTDHFIEPFLQALVAIGIEPVEKRGSRMYAAGEYDDAIRVAFEKAEAIREILVRVAKSKKAPGWVPFDPICDNCGRIATTDALGFEGGRVRYRCAGGVAGRKEMVGCGHEGAASLRHGKLTWRVEWAARWKILRVTCEPFGKEHSAAGGSYDTSKVISKDVFGYEPPEPVLYEHILVGGAKMSKSKGNVIALGELLDVLPAEAVRYFFFRVDPNKHKDFDPRQKLLPLVDEYERAQAIVAGRASATRAEDGLALRRAFELSQVRRSTAVDHGPIPFSHLLTVAQLTGSTPDALAVLGRSGFEVPGEPNGKALLALRVECARRFVARYVRPDDRIVLLGAGDPVPSERFPPKGGAFLGALADALEKVPWQAEIVHNTIFEVSRDTGLDGKDGFRCVYLALTGRDRGPRAGYFVASLDRAFVLARFRHASSPR